jgi:hypothetical protein
MNLARGDLLPENRLAATNPFGELIGREGLRYCGFCMEPINGKERRQNPRHLLRCQWRGAELPLLETAGHGNGNGIIKAWVENISTGGLCLLTDQLVHVFRPIRCQIFLAEIPPGLPLLMQVRWTQEMSYGPRYRIGLRFLA